MNKNEAVQLMDLLLAINDPLNDATAVTKTMVDEEEAKVIRRKLAGVMSGVYEAMLPIIKEYPELDPDKHMA